MPTVPEIERLRQKLWVMEDESLLMLLQLVQYTFPPREDMFVAPNGNKLVLNMPVGIDRYLELTGFQVSQLRQQIRDDICDNAHALPDRFYAVYRAAGLATDAEQEAANLESIKAHAGAIAKNTVPKKIPFYRDRRFMVTVIALVVSIIGIVVGVLVKGGKRG